MLSKYSRLWLAFLISGLVHYTSDIAMGIPPSQSGSPRFFMLQALGITLEDGFQALVIRCRWLDRGGRIGKSARVLARVWVISFLVWSTPTWFYPQQRLGVDPTSLLPVRIVPTIIRFLAR